MMSSTYSISDLAREFGITTRTIRHYEELGLVSPQRRGQTRIYSSADRTRLKLILRGKRLGFSLEESREIIDMYHPGRENRAQLEHLLAGLDDKRQRLQKQRRDIDAMLAEMDQVEKDCRTALGRGAT